jgi:DNA-binding MarR family transcriptional regulator
MLWAIMDRENRDDILNKTAADLLSVPPLLFRGIRRKLFEAAKADVDINITPLHFEILFLLNKDGPMHIAAIGNRLQIARAQMTQLIDRLVDLRLAERNVDIKDRRTINVSLTEKGRAFLKEQMHNLNSVTREILSSLTDDELEQISTSLIKLRDALVKP